VRDLTRLIVPVLALVALASGVAIGAPRLRQPSPRPSEVAGARYRLDRAGAGSSGALYLSDVLRRRGFRFDPGVSAADRQAFLAAVADARPEARELIALVDGLVDVHVAATGGQALGVTSETPTGYDMTVDLARVGAMYGRRGIDRVVLHELGHVIDFALVPDDATGPLDAEIPRGWGCENGTTGACASRAERFAETFAKWATGDLGADLYVGYKVPPPSVSLESWGRPLAELAAGAAIP
jgi:hypothetical protein